MKLYFTLDYFVLCPRKDPLNHNFTSLLAIGGAIQYFSFFHINNLMFYCFFSCNYLLSILYSTP
jgi:hypothetical protein